MLDCFHVALPDTFLNHCELGCIVSWYGCPAERAVIVHSSLLRHQKAALADPLHAADIKVRMLAHGQFDEVEADGAPVPLWPLVATRHQTPLEISCGGQVGRIGSSCISRIIGHNTLVYDEGVHFSVSCSAFASGSRARLHRSTEVRESESRFEDPDNPQSFCPPLRWSLLHSKTLPLVSIIPRCWQLARMKWAIGVFPPGTCLWLWQVWQSAALHRKRLPAVQYFYIHFDIKSANKFTFAVPSFFFNGVVDVNLANDSAQNRNFLLYTCNYV